MGALAFQSILLSVLIFDTENIVGMHVAQDPPPFAALPEHWMYYPEEWAAAAEMSRH
jgi:hypothetical protein